MSSQQLYTHECTCTICLGLPRQYTKWRCVSMWVCCDAVSLKYPTLIPPWGTPVLFLCANRLNYRQFNVEWVDASEAPLLLFLAGFITLCVIWGTRKHTVASFLLLSSILYNVQVYFTVILYPGQNSILYSSISSLLDTSNSFKMVKCVTTHT